MRTILLPTLITEYELTNRINQIKLYLSEKNYEKLNEIDDKGETCLYKAIKVRDLALCESLIEILNNQTINVLNKNNSSVLNEALSRHMWEISKLLIPKLSNQTLEAKTLHEGLTVLHNSFKATMFPKYEIINLLITKCPKLINITTNKGVTPLDLLVKNCIFNSESAMVIKLLIERGGNYSNNLFQPNWFFPYKYNINIIDKLLDKTLDPSLKVKIIDNLQDCMINRLCYGIIEKCNSSPNKNEFVEFKTYLLIIKEVLPETFFEKIQSRIIDKMAVSEDALSMFEAKLISLLETNETKLISSVPYKVLEDNCFKYKVTKLEMDTMLFYLDNPNYKTPGFYLNEHLDNFEMFKEKLGTDPEKWQVLLEIKRELLLDPHFEKKLDNLIATENFEFEAPSKLDVMILEIFAQINQEKTFSQAISKALVEYNKLYPLAETSVSETITIGDPATFVNDVDNL